MILAALSLAHILASSTLEAQSGSPPRPVAIRADAVWLGDGRILEKATVILENGRISDVGTNVTVPAGFETIEHKGVLTAGMIALHGYTGAHDEVRDDTRTVLPEARVAAAFDPSHPALQEARESGITSLLLTPAPAGVAPGIAAVVKSAGRRILVPESHVSLVFSASGLDNRHEPTSYAGAMAMLEKLFEKPSGVVESAASGKLPVLFEASSREDVQRVLDFAKRHRLVGAIHGAALAGELAEDIKKSKLSVIVPELPIGADRRALKGVIALAKNEIPFGFGLDSPWNHPAQLRIDAALCVREGLDPQVAWSALTSNAARIAGVADKVGRIERGLEGDIVLWSGDPLDLQSRIDAVYVDGARVFGAEKP
jgi:imidazolonepropionase-like amidohydrolase